MPKRHDKITKSVNYDYYWDILFCTVPLLAVSCFYYGARPLLMMAAGLLTADVEDCGVSPLPRCMRRGTAHMSLPAKLLLR